MYYYTKKVIKEIINPKRIPDIIISYIIALCILFFVFRDLLGEISTVAILALAAVVIVAITIAVITGIKAIQLEVKAQKEDRKNTNGFTLVEMIVVIVIIAILLAALTPAVLGVVRRANTTADEADARSVLMMAGVLAAENQTTVYTFQADMENEMHGGRFPTGALFTIHYEDGYPISVVFTTNARTTNGVTVGRYPIPADTQTRTFTAP